MADLRGTYRSTKGSPYFDYDVSYKEIGRNGSSATYRVSLRVRMTSSYSKYGYGIRAYAMINGAKSEKQIKNNGGMWSGGSWQGTWTFDIKASAGTGGGTLPAEIKVWGTDGGSAPNFTIGGKTVSLSTWNTAPYWTSDDGNVNGWKCHKIIPENTGKVHVYPPKASDREGNKINYDTFKYVNDKQVAKVCQNGNVNGFEDDLSDLGQGTQIKYKFRVDDFDAFSDYKWSWTYTKNTLTPANVSIPNSITFDTNEINVNLSGQGNTDGTNNFTFRISSNNFTIYNADSLTGNTKIAIHKSGNAPSTPYINFEDIKNFVKGNGWKGTATIEVETRNAYGSRASRSTTVNIDLRTNPTTVSTINVGGETVVAGGKYFIPSRGAFSVSWSGASDKLGGGITYELQGAYAGGDWTTLKTNLTGTSTQVTLDAVNKAINYRFRVVAKTNFGYNSYSGEKVITLHYYNQPKIYIKNTNRSATQFSAEVYTQTDTSISAVAINMRQWQDKDGTFHNFAGSPYRFEQNGLNESQSYTKQVKCSDNSGLAESTVVLNYQVSSYVPIVSIRKKGLGINTVADDVHKLKVNGRARAYAFTSEGYETHNSGSDCVNKWVKVASFRVTYRYGDASATIDFLDSGSGSNIPVSGRLKCRVKQQDEFTKPTALGLFLENPSWACSVDDFYLVVTKNVSGEVIAELWYRCSMSYTSVFFYPSQCLGDVTMYAHQPFQNNIPAGQNKKAEYTPVFADSISGKPIGIPNNDTLGGFIPTVQNDGVMEVGKYIDFHPVKGKDFCPRIEAYDNGLVISGDLTMSESKRIITSNNYGIMGKLRNGNIDYMLYTGNDDRIKLSYNNRPVDVQTNDFKANGRRVLTDIQGTPLWKGYHHMSKNERVTPSKPLSQCNNGWVLVWSDWDDGGTGSNWNFCFTHIPKNTPWLNGYNHTFPLTGGETSWAIKTLYIYDSYFTGNDTNKKGDSYDVVIRAVLEY